MLEGGGTEIGARSQRLYNGQNEGQSYFRLDACRWRVLGGTTNRWGGWCRPLDPQDFEARDWLPYSGWPIGAQDLQPYYAEAARFLELPNACFELSDWHERLSRPIPLEGTHFGNTLFQFSPDSNMPLAIGPSIWQADNVRTLIHANATDIRLDPVSRRVGSIKVVTPGGKTMTVHPKAVVLAAGGIENARLLLASRKDSACGLGNETDAVGRYFMEHIHAPFGHLLASPRLFDRQFYRKTNLGDVRLRGLMTPTAAARDEHRMLPTSIAIESPSFSFGTPFVGWPPPLIFAAAKYYKRLRRRGINSPAERLRQMAERAAALSNYLSTWRSARAARAQAGVGPNEKLYSLYFRAEQAPDPANRIVLSDRRDALGMPESQLIWNIKPADEAGVFGWLKVLTEDFRARGLGRVLGPAGDWKAGITGGPHHMGTTRMSANPHTGVVDSDCRVHSVENLFVAGSSVFATGGYVNPTFTIVALSLRLADILKKRLSSVPEVAAGAEANA